MNFGRKSFLLAVQNKNLCLLLLNKSRNLSSTQYCVDTIKQYDYENYVCTLLLKNTTRTCSIAVRAFNVEVSRIQDQISDPKIGLMRMKFWEDALEKCFDINNNVVPNHPVVVELNRVVRLNKFTKRYFTNLIKSRKEIMTSTIFPTLENMENYAEKTSSSVYYLILEASNIRNVHADHAASHLGKAQGIAQLIRSLPLSRQLNFIALPQDILTEEKISYEDVLRRKQTDGIKECVFKVATRANQHLEKARSLSKDLSPDAKRVLLPAVAVDSYLSRLLRFDCNVFDEKLLQRNLSWIPKVWWNNFRQTY